MKLYDYCCRRPSRPTICPAVLSSAGRCDTESITNLWMN